MKVQIPRAPELRAELPEIASRAPAPQAPERETAAGETCGGSVPLGGGSSEKGARTRQSCASTDSGHQAPDNLRYRARGDDVARTTNKGETR